MSLAAVLHEAERLVESNDIWPEARAEVIAVLRANRSDNLALALSLGLEAGISAESALLRAAAVYFNVAACQVGDDVADGECTYLENPAGSGPVAQYVLQHLYYSTLLAAGIECGVLLESARALARGAGAQSIDLRHGDWDLERARRTASGFGGWHQAAYLQVIWHGSAYAASSRDVGFGLGVAISVASDIRSRDRRFMALCGPDRAALVEWALSSLEPARSLALPTLQRAVSSLEGELLWGLAQP